MEQTRTFLFEEFDLNPDDQNSYIPLVDMHLGGTGEDSPLKQTVSAFFATQKSASANVLTKKHVQEINEQQYPGFRRWVA